MRTFKIFPVILLFFLVNCEKYKPLYSSEIDDLQTVEEVQSVIRKTDTLFKKYEIKKIGDFKRSDNISFIENQKLAKKFDVDKAFYKTDFDGNGFTDLLVTGDQHTCFTTAYGQDEDESCSYNPIVLLNFGRGSYRIIDISQGIDDCLTPKIKKVNNRTILSVYKPVVKDWEKKTFEDTPFVQDLEYKFGEFIEYNSNDKNYIPITKIEFSTSGCFGTCPVFQMTIDQNRKATFIAEHFNFSDDDESWSENIEGKFHTVIDEKNYNMLINTLQYIDFPSLKDRYSVNWTDDQTVNLKITYADNKVKEIEDYGLIGTYGLKSVYNKLFQLRKNQKWIKY